MGQQVEIYLKIRQLGVLLWSTGKLLGSDSLVWETGLWIPIQTDFITCREAEWVLAGRGEEKSVEGRTKRWEGWESG